MDEIFKALADSHRRQLLDRLREDNGLTLSQLVAPLGMSRQAVTKHLTILEAANLITTIFRGREKLHYLNPVPLHEVARRWIKPFESAPLESLHQLKTKLES
jgi:DNA-binding transcriptional ArsR family regulator